MNKVQSIDEYIQQQPETVQSMLIAVKETIEKAAPNAVGGIGYGMPAYKLNGKPLAYFAAAKKHIGFYGTPVTHEAFANELSKYKQGKGSVQFSLDQKMPIALITKMVKFKAKRIDADKKTK